MFTHALLALELSGPNRFLWLRCEGDCDYCLHKYVYKLDRLTMLDACTPFYEAQLIVRKHCLWFDVQKRILDKAWSDLILSDNHFGQKTSSYIDYYFCKKLLCLLNTPNSVIVMNTNTILK